MKNLLTKKNILWISGIGGGLAIIFLFPTESGICGRDNYSCRQTANALLMFFGIFFPLFLFSLITYKMKDEVFESWIFFAKWFVPLLVAATLFFQGGGPSGGFGGAVSDWFDAMILGALYVIFIVTSLIKIISTFLKTRKAKNK